MGKLACLTIIGALIALPFSSEANTRSGAASAEVGRYQLFQGSYTTFDLKRKETYVHQGVFLLDSVTGQVRRYINKIDEDGRYIETWVPTELPLQDKKK